MGCAVMADRPHASSTMAPSRALAMVPFGGREQRPRLARADEAKSERLKNFSACQPPDDPGKGRRAFALKTLSSRSRLALCYYKCGRVTLILVIEVPPGLHGPPLVREA
jgi:hypothetical protein